MKLFTASWCNPCKRLKEWLEVNYHGNDIEHHDVEVGELAKQYGIEKIPALVIDDGSIITTNENIRPFLLSKQDLPIKCVIKRDGSLQPFDVEKLNRWAQYASEVGGNWSHIALNTFKRLENSVKTTDIHETMIRVCLDEEKLEYSRVASRLLYASLRKNMLNELSIHDKMSFEDIFHTMLSSGLWKFENIVAFNPEWNEWYKEIREERLEYWQVRQWMDKYSLQIDDHEVETPHIGAIGIGLAIHGDTIKAFELAKAIIKGKLNLPTPILNGCRNGDFNGISCCVIEGGDTVDSIGVAEHIAYKMTAKKSGIGITFQTRSLGAPVKGGRVKHLGKHGIYKTLDKAVKMFTQVSRGGSATMTYTAIDPEIEQLIIWKSQKIDIEDRIDKMDFSLAYNDAFLQAVIKDEYWSLIDFHDSPDLHESFYIDTADEYNRKLELYKESGGKCVSIKARDILKKFLTVRQETGRLYCINVTRANDHTPFKDVIHLSNLCQEIALPTKQYVDMNDLYCSTKSQGETAFCSLAAINVSKIVDDVEYEQIAKLAIETIDVMIDLAPMMTMSMSESVKRRRSIGVGITGLAGYLYSNGLDYDGTPETELAIAELAEMHYYYLLKASQDLVEENELTPVTGIDNSWLPIDTMKNIINYRPKLDWEALRGKPRRNSVLVAHMPTESSAVFSDATNGVYPVRKRVINKSSRNGAVQYIAPEGDYRLAWDVDNKVLSKYYSIIQDFTDQAISADYYVDFTKYEDGKVPMSTLMKEWVIQAKYGNKTMYYVNSNDDNGGSFQDQQDEGCESGACKL